MSTLPTVDGETDVVVSARWALTGTDGSITSDVKRVSRFILKADHKFVPYADLTEAQVIEWVQAGIGETELKSLMKRVQRGIDVLNRQADAILHPPVLPTTQPLPWAVAV